MPKYHLMGDNIFKDYWMLLIGEGYNWFYVIKYGISLPHPPYPLPLANIY